MTSSAFDAKTVAEIAISSIGLGYDLTNDLRLQFCKRNSLDSRLIAFDDDQVRNIQLPGDISIPNVPKSIKCDKGERMTRLCSDVRSFQQMSEYFNQEVSLTGRIPTGHFNAAFEFTQGWQKDAANTKSLAFDGVFITLYSIALDKTKAILRDYVKQAVPSSWDPKALTRFIERYGTHITVRVKIGGTDIIYAKQQYSSPLQPAGVQKKLGEVADKFFIDEAASNNAKLMTDNGLASMGITSSSYSQMEVQDIMFIRKRRGGNLKKYISHNEWCQTVQSQPDVISMSFIPITSVLGGLSGSGFLTHAINLYLRYKPSIEELHQFLEFQLPRQWAPVFGELALGPERKSPNTAFLQFSFMGPKLYVNTKLVDVGNRPVTGLRLYLEGKRSNCLAIHLQHLSSLPKTFQLQDELNRNVSDASSERKFYEKVKWKHFSHVCTAPIDSDDDNSVVTGAWLEVGGTGLKKVLFLRLYFSKVIGATCLKAPEWDGSPGLTQKSGIISTFISTHFSAPQKALPPPWPSDVNINSDKRLDESFSSATYPVPTKTPKVLRFVDTRELTRGPEDCPGYWVVSGARLYVENGKISLKVKFTLLAVIPNEQEATA